MTVSLLSTQCARHQAALDAYRNYLAVIQEVQGELSDIAEELIDQEGWEKDVREGVREWVGDRGVSWRALRRARFDATKAQALLLKTLTNRVRLDLHTPIPSMPPYTFLPSDTLPEPVPPLFAFLPYPQFGDTLGRPIAVVSLRQVKRDFSRTAEDEVEDAVRGRSRARVAGTEGLTELAWWIAEQGRRVVRDIGQLGEARGRRRRKGKEKESIVLDTESADNGFKGEGEEIVKGYVVMVDVQGAGLSNLQLELLPHLINIHHNHYPGLVTSIFIVNHTWTSQALWACLKRVLPTAALDKIVWLDNVSEQGRREMGALFDLNLLPTALGGAGNYDLAVEPDVMLQRYAGSHHEWFNEESHSPLTTKSDSSSLHAMAMARTTSAESIADVYYTAVHTPASSRPQTPAPGLSRALASKRARSSQNLSALGLQDLRMTKATDAPQSSNALGLISDQMTARATGLRITIPADQEVHEGPSQSRKRPRSPSKSPHAPDMEPPQTPMQRIKSLTDFRLYLSPSRRANIDLLLGSDDEDEVDKAPSVKQPPPAKRPPIGPLSQRRLSALRSNPEAARSYSASLTRHHARTLSEKVLAEPAPRLELPEPIVVQPQSWENPKAETVKETPAQQQPVEGSLSRHPERAISAYDRTTNPMFGYPVVEIVGGGTSLRPRYGRKRKRDLAKALLYLFLLRLASLREWVDMLLRSFGLTTSSTSSYPSTSGANHRGPVSHTPDAAFERWSRQLASNGHSKAVDRRAATDGSAGDRNFVWMIFTLLIIRGGVPLGWEKLVTTLWEGWSKLRGAVVG